MSYLNHIIRTGRSPIDGLPPRRFWNVFWLSLLTLTAALAQKPTLPASPTACDYNTAPANISLTAQNVPSGFSTVYLLVNLNSGMIVQVNTSAPSFTSVAQGDYYAVPLHYTGSLVNAQAGKLVSEIASSALCMTYGTALALRVCPAIANCDYAPAPATLTFTANSMPGGVTTSYVLVNTATNLIAAVSSSASFPNVPQGDYAITSIHYTGSLTALTVGNRLYDVATENRDGGPENCPSVSNTIYVKVCNAPPTIAIVGPANNGTATTSPTVSGTATPGSVVNVTGPGGATLCSTTATAGGSWSCTVSVPVGPNTLTATACNAVGCATTTTSFTALPPCLTLSVGGSASLVGGNSATLCSPTNGGSINLTGQTGTVLRWETSTDNGGTWTAIASTAGLTTYNFTNAANEQQYRAVVNKGGSCADANSSALTITTSASACSTACDYAADVITK